MKRLRFRKFRGIASKVSVAASLVAKRHSVAERPPVALLHPPMAAVVAGHIESVDEPFAPLAPIGAIREMLDTALAVFPRIGRRRTGIADNDASGGVVWEAGVRGRCHRVRI